MLKIDTHFHPNFLFRLPKQFGVVRQSKNIWKAFSVNDLDAVIVTEHVFKSPALSYKILEEQRPEDVKTVLIPGVEASTSEGIDMIIFSEDTYVYTCEEIMTTKHLTFDEMVEYVNNDDRLYGVVTHPFSPSSTAITKHRSHESILAATQALGIIEKHNASFIGIKRWLENSRFAHVSFVKSFVQKLDLLENVTENHYEKNSILFGGSDAHHPDDIGSYTVFDTGNSKSSIWETLSDHSVPRYFQIQEKRANMLIFIVRNFFIIARERIINVFRLYAMDATYFPLALKKKKIAKMDALRLCFLRCKKKISGIESY